MNINKLKLKPSSTIAQALQILGKERVRIALVLAEDESLLGVLTDSDIRKALLSGKALQSSIEGIYSTHPKTINTQTKKDEIFALASKYDIYDFPVLNEKNQVLKIVSLAKILEPNFKPNYVVLMLGGLGSRLAPLTNSLQSPCLR